MIDTAPDPDRSLLRRDEQDTAFMAGPANASDLDARGRLYQAPRTRTSLRTAPGPAVPIVVAKGRCEYSRTT